MRLKTLSFHVSLRGGLAGSFAINFIFENDPETKTRTTENKYGTGTGWKSNPLFDLIYVLGASVRNPISVILLLNSDPDP